MSDRIQASQAISLLPKMPAPALAFARMARSASLWMSRHRSRAALTRLDAHLLRDIGLSAPAAQTEAQKPFWPD